MIHAANQFPALYDAFAPREPSAWQELRGDFLAFVSAVRRDPMLAGVCAGLGFGAGLFVTVGLAWVWSLFL